MYTYEIAFLNDKNRKSIIRWGCTCNDPKITLQMAKGTCESLNIRYAIITIREDNGKFISLHIFDKVLK